ncbi:MAG: hypothetical protein ACERKD_20415 [Prolixibacteraceae bacterium]
MEDFDRNKNLHNMIREFKQTDEFYDSFRHQFIISLFLLVKRYYKELKLDLEMNNNLKLYADEMLSCVESVLYKDSTYPDFRMEEELGMMNRIVNKEPTEEENAEFIDKIHLKAKEMIVMNYSGIEELSGTGFRLLEKYSKMYNWEFVSNFYALLKQRV